MRVNFGPLCIAPRLEVSFKYRDVRVSHSLFIIFWDAGSLFSFSHFNAKGGCCTSRKCIMSRVKHTLANCPMHFFKEALSIVMAVVVGQQQRRLFTTCAKTTLLWPASFEALKSNLLKFESSLHTNVILCSY